MAVGKYSPTVSKAYMMSRDWWKPAEKHGQYDAAGFDSYGYNEKDIDRAGNHEDDYMSGEWIDDDHYVYALYETVLDDWTVDAQGQPAKR